ncbi:MAG TPA: exonuclease domain-containing protein [Roseiflexaceae bacterium]|nr:exonuclease domain-containing protein [Roseiflexaceae bacterium]
MLDLPLSSVPLAFLDFETTGLAPRRGDRVCEVALQRVVGGVVETSFETLVNPLRPLSERSFAVNRITPEQLAGAPTFSTIAESIRAALSGAAIVAHNAPFDLEFLYAELALAGQPPLRAPAIDTLAIARRLFPRRPSHSLAALATALGSPPPSHRAMDDVLVLRVVFDHLVAQLAPLGITTLGDMLRYGRGLRPGDPEPVAPPPIAEALRDGKLLRIVYASRSLPEPTERLIRPIEIANENGVLFLRAYCYFREDLRAFIVEKIMRMDLLEE